MVTKLNTKQKVLAVLICIVLLIVAFGVYKLIASGLASDFLHFSEKNYVIITTDLPKSELENMEVLVQKVPLFTNKETDRELEWTNAEFWSEKEFHHIVLGRGNYRVKAVHPENGSRSTVLKIDGTSDVYAVNLGFYTSASVSDVNRSDNHVTSQGVPIPDGAYIWNGHAYVVIDKQKEWHDAKALCESLGGYLATVTSEEEQAIVTHLASASGYERYWLGGYIEENSWKWVTGEDFNYQCWAYGEPNGESNGMVMHIIGDLWDDTYPEGQQHGNLPIQRIICEWELADSTGETAE